MPQGFRESAMHGFEEARTIPTNARKRFGLHAPGVNDKGRYQSHMLLPLR
jgi:hypothetical protein